MIYAIALGAVERGRHYLDTYPGWGGWMLALACTGVVFLAGGKLLDSVQTAGSRPLRAGLMPRRCGAARLLVVVDPGACRRIALQSHGLHVAQIDAGPGDRAPRRDLRADIERAIGIAELHRSARAGRGRAPSGFQSLVPARRIDSSAKRRPVPLTRVKLDAPANAGGGRCER